MKEFKKLGRTKTIYMRTDKKKHRFEQISRDLLRDYRLSPDAFRILLYYLSNTDQWQPSVTRVKELLRMGRKRWENAWDEIEKYGYGKKPKNMGEYWLVEINENGNVSVTDNMEDLFL
jgi:hypothetical protein